MVPEQVKPAIDDKPAATAMIDPLHWYDRIVHVGLGLYAIGAGCVIIWRSLTGPAAVQVAPLLWGLFFAGVLGPAAVYWFTFRARSTARAIPMGIVKRVIGIVSALLVTMFAMATIWMTALHPEVRPGAPLGVDWDSILGPTTILVLGLYGLYAFGLKGVDVVP